MCSQATNHFYKMLPDQMDFVFTQRRGCFMETKIQVPLFMRKTLSRDRLGCAWSTVREC